MGEELNQQVDAGGGAPEGDASQAASSEAATQEPQQMTVTPELQAMIKKEVDAVRAEYEGKGGHISQLRSKKDKEIAALKRQLNERRQTDLQGALSMLQTNPAKAAQLLAQQVQELTQQTTTETRAEALTDWVTLIMEDQGHDLENEEAAEFAAEWMQKIEDDPDLTYDFIQQAAMVRIGAKDKEVQDVRKELKEYKENLPTLIKQEVTRILAGSGLTPEPTGEGAAGKRREDWRNLSEGQLIKMGLAEMEAAAVERQ